MKKSLLIILFGEPRGIGNSNDCPGSNQFDVILRDEHLMKNVDKIHVHWSITTEKISFQHWDNSFMIDKYGNRWDETEYLPEEQICHNIDKFMSEYSEKLTYDIHIRKKSSLRWGMEYHKVILDAIDEKYDYVMFHRPDSNISTSKTEIPLYEKFFETNIPCVCVTENPNDTLWTFYENGIEDKPWTGFYVVWNPYEIMLWNRDALILLEQFIRLKVKYENEYVNGGWTIGWSEGFPEEKGVFQSWHGSQRIDQGENFWSVTLLAISTFAHNFMVIDQLPFRSLIRMKGD